jgi:hypothetical protein
MDEAASKGSRKRAKKVVELEKEGRTNPEAKAKAKELDKKSAKSEKSRVAKASATRSSEARKDKGVSVQGMRGVERIGAKDKVKEKDIHIGNTTNGIKRDGEIIGNPTANQIKTAMRDFDSRNAIAAKAKVIKEAKAFIKRARGPEGTPAMRRDANTIEKLMDQMKGRKSMASENARKDQARRRAQDTPEKKAARREEARKSYARSQKGLREKARKAVPATPMAYGGSVTGKARTGHTDMRKGGLFK